MPSNGGDLALEWQGDVSGLVPSLEPETMEQSVDTAYAREQFKHSNMADTMANLGQADDHHQKTALAKFVESPSYDVGISTVIMINAALLIHETNIKAQQAEIPRYMEYADLVLVAVYCVDVAIRILAQGRRFFRKRSCLFDLFLVAMDVITNTLGFFNLGFGLSVSFLRIFRLAKIFRLMVMLSYFDELFLMLKLMLSAARTMLWGVVLMFAFLTVWSIVAVRVLHPLNREIAQTTNLYDNCERCERAFESVQQTILTFFQTIVAGDSWGEVSVVLIEHYPWTFPLLFLVVIFMQLWLLNLVITVMIEQAQLARENDIAERIKRKKEGYAVAEESFVKMCQHLDTDNSGNVSLSELMEGYESSADWAETLALMDLGKNDIAFIFTLMDQDNSGTVSYKEFAHQLHVMAPSDLASAVAYTRALMTRFLEKDFRQFRERTIAMLTSLTPKDGGKKVGRETLEAPGKPEARGNPPDPVVSSRRGSVWGQDRANLKEDVKDIMEEVRGYTDVKSAEGAAQGEERPGSARKVMAWSTSKEAAENACAPAEQAPPVGGLSSTFAAASHAGSTLPAAGLPTGDCLREASEEEGDHLAPSSPRAPEAATSPRVVRPHSRDAMQ